MTGLTDPTRFRVALIQFPGSNCDQDCVDVLQQHFQINPQLVWHQQNELPKVDAVILPGGFSYGDYLRGGCLASHSPIMKPVKEYGAKGGPIIGICNGFQILTESQLLPGALLPNDSKKFVCEQVTLKAPPGSTPLQKVLSAGEAQFQVPVAHGEGRYYIDQQGLARLWGEGLVAFQYSNKRGQPVVEANPNGSVDHIAGIVSPDGRILGMMPHPERAADRRTELGTDGLRVLTAFFNQACG